MAQLTKNNKRSIKSTWREINWHVEGSAERHALRARGATFPSLPSSCPAPRDHPRVPRPQGTDTLPGTHPGHGVVTLGPGSTRVPPQTSPVSPPGIAEGGQAAHGARSASLTLIGAVKQTQIYRLLPSARSDAARARPPARAPPRTERLRPSAPLGAPQGAWGGAGGCPPGSLRPRCRARHGATRPRERRGRITPVTAGAWGQP